MIRSIFVRYDMNFLRKAIKNGFERELLCEWLLPALKYQRREHAFVETEEALLQHCVLEAV